MFSLFAMLFLVPEGNAFILTTVKWLAVALDLCLEKYETCLLWTGRRAVSPIRMGSEYLSYTGHFDYLQTDTFNSEEIFKILNSFFLNQE